MSEYMSTAEWDVKILNAEIDRLRAEVHEANAACDAQIRESNHLRADNEELRGWLESAINNIDNPLITMHMSAILAKTAK